MKTWVSLAAISLSLTLSAAATEASAMLCGQRVVVVETLKSIKEKQTSVAVTDSGNLLEVFVSEIGSWTLLMTTPAGVACVVATGNDWETFPADSKVARLFGGDAPTPAQPTTTR